ncbi:MAG: ABC transporter permease [Thiogranum sp.]|nr:ABC transporter permease [Thiogranum sp.]
MSDLSPAFEISEPGGAKRVIGFAGDWVAGQRFPDPSELLGKSGATDKIELLYLDGANLGRWDTLFVSFIYRLSGEARAADIELDDSGLPEGARKLVELATAVSERHGVRKLEADTGWLAALGTATINTWKEVHGLLLFAGELTLGLSRLLRGKARFRGVDFGMALQHAGPQALPIVGLISVLVGMILAYVGALQLKAFGAELYIADLVALGMVREMGAMMTAIIMAGRTGAAYASQLGTMQVNEEIDALRTLGFSPIDFLVLPRMLALILMMPLLCLYADFLGILGGALVGALTLDISLLEYYVQARRAVGMDDIWAGIIKSAVFGVLVAAAGCMHGIQSGRSASAVGNAATSAVVTGIVFIVVADALLTIFYDLIGL